MNKKLKNILFVTVWSCVIGMVTFFSINAHKQQKGKLCKELIISMNSNVSDSFVTTEEIEGLIYDSIGNIINQPLKNIDLLQIKRIISSKPFVEDVVVYSALSGEISIDIVQRDVIARIFNSIGETFYIDRKGVLLPVSENYSKRVVVASGYIHEPFSMLYSLNLPSVVNEKPILYRVYRTAEYLSRDNFWNAMIDQIYIASNGDIQLIPKFGTHRVIIGDIENIVEKLENLLVFYKKVLYKKGWDTYQIVNIKYNNQIVCSQ